MDSRIGRARQILLFLANAQPLPREWRQAIGFHREVPGEYQGDEDLQGHFGDGEGKWQLEVTANRPLRVMGLMRTESGSLTNLSC